MAESTRLSPVLDPDSPYCIDSDFLSNFDSPNIILSLEEDNYIFWKLRFHYYLRLANKLGFINGTLEKPDPSSTLYLLWKICDELVKSWLIKSMSDKVLRRVMHAKTAQIMWEDVRRVFVPNLELKVYELRGRIAMLRQDGDSVTTYYDKLNKAWTELSEYDPVPECACGCCKCDIKKRGEEARESEELYTFLMGLNNISLSRVKAVIMLMKPPPSVYQAYIMVKQAESDMKTGH